MTDAIWNELKSALEKVIDGPAKRVDVELWACHVTVYRMGSPQAIRMDLKIAEAPSVRIGTRDDERKIKTAGNLARDCKLRDRRSEGER